MVLWCYAENVKNAVNYLFNQMTLDGKIVQMMASSPAWYDFPFFLLLFENQFTGTEHWEMEKVALNIERYKSNIISVSKWKIGSVTRFAFH